MVVFLVLFFLVDVFEEIEDDGLCDEILGCFDEWLISWVVS